uniref:PH domain-containing protein n=1 Tax=Glossina brevipalpis TaxID=37001 RepID=A0A1A9WDJ4_9MUSC
MRFVPVEREILVNVLLVVYDLKLEAPPLFTAANMDAKKLHHLQQSQNVQKKIPLAYQTNIADYRTATHSPVFQQQQQQQLSYHMSHVPSGSSNAAALSAQYQQSPTTTSSSGPLSPIDIQPQASKLLLKHQVTGGSGGNTSSSAHSSPYHQPSTSSGYPTSSGGTGNTSEQLYQSPTERTYLAAAGRLQASHNPASTLQQQYQQLQQAKLQAQLQTQNEAIQHQHRTFALRQAMNPPVPQGHYHMSQSSSMVSSVTQQSVVQQQMASQQQQRAPPSSLTVVKTSSHTTQNTKTPSSEDSSSASAKSPTHHPVDRKKSSGGSNSSNTQALKSPLTKRPPSSPVTISGWLYKQGSDGLKVWRKRWFVLAEYCLYYYKGPEEEKLLGSILLPSYKVSACLPEDKIYRKFAFKCEHQNMRTYWLAAENPESMVQWVRALSAATMMQASASGGESSEQPSVSSSSANQSGENSDSGIHTLQSQQSKLSSQGQVTPASDSGKNPATNGKTQYQQQMSLMNEEHSKTSPGSYMDAQMEAQIMQLQQQRAAVGDDIYGERELYMQRLIQQRYPSAQAPHYGTSNSERRTPDAYGRSKNRIFSDYEDIYNFTQSGNVGATNVMSAQEALMQEAASYRRPLSPPTYDGHKHIPSIPSLYTPNHLEPVNY